MRVGVSNIFSSDTTGPIEAKFHMEPPCDGQRKFVQTVRVTWPRWPPCPYNYGKNLKISSSPVLKGLWPYDLETWSVALGAQVLPSLFKWWPWVDLDLFYGKVNLFPYAFVCEKGKRIDISETIVVYDVKVDRCS